MDPSTKTSQSPENVPLEQSESTPVSATTPKASDLLNSELAEAWLSWQCQMLSGTVVGKLYQASEGKPLGSVLAIWPASGEGEQYLDAAANEALTSGKGTVHTRVQYGPGDKRIADIVSCPLQVEGHVFAVVSVMLSTRADSQHQAVLQLLQWGGLWMDTLVQQRDVSSINLQVMSTMLNEDKLNATILALSNFLAERYVCERVAIGLRKGISIKLQAMSHVTHLDSRTQLVRGIESAMEEAVDQDQLMLYPGDAHDKYLGTSRAHQDLAGQRNVTVCTIPLRGCSNLIGAITMEIKTGQSFDKRSMQECESLARIVGPVLELKQRNERPIWSSGSERLLGTIGGVVGLGHLKLKLALLFFIVLLTAMSMIDGPYRITTEASVEGAIRQLLVAPQDGYIKQASVRAGDIVKQGEVIALLDDSDLLLQKQKWLGERNKINKHYQEALAKRDRIELNILRAQLAQVEAEISLLDAKIGRTQLRVPFDGVVVSGDHSQSLGAPVVTGQVLFEVTPLENYRVVLEVDEHDVAGLEAGKTGQLIIAALPEHRFPVSVIQVIPVAVAEDARNYFRVEASLDEPDSLLRPGMQGIAKIDIGERKMLWIWTHRLLDQLYLWFWSLGI
jgi:multidrug efflux pump subunit AcrA (membrane-fusion protein)